MTMTPGLKSAVATPLLHALWSARNGRLPQPEKKGRSPNLRKKGFVSGSPHPEGWARHSTTLKDGVSQRSPARGRPSMAGAAARIRGRLARHRHELPRVRAVTEGELEHAVHVAIPTRRYLCRRGSLTDMQRSG